VGWEIFEKPQKRLYNGREADEDGIEEKEAEAAGAVQFNCYGGVIRRTSKKEKAT
jgi:hypothetical protein